jgi:hypothetical protein
MKEFFAVVDEIKIYRDEIYYYYDEPLLFTCIDENNQKYVVMTINTDEWLCVPVSDMILSQFKENKIPIKSLFLSPEKNVYRLIAILGNISAKSITPNNIKIDELPLENEFLYN